MELVFILPMLALIFASSFFSAGETALFSLPRREAGTGAVRRILKDQRALLITVLLGNTFVNILYACIAALMSMSVHARHGDVTAALAGTTALVVLITFGEVVPKIIAVWSPGPIARFAAPILLVFSGIVWPVRIVFEKITRVLTRVLISPDKTAEDQLTSEELDEMVVIGGEAGLIGKAQHELLRNVLDISNVRVRQIMVPRVDAALAEISIGRDGILKLASVRRMTKIPVYERDTDHILGICHVKDLLVNPDADVRALLWKPRYVPESMKVELLLSYFRTAEQGICLVVDEYGAFSGIVTIEDTAEEVVGDLLDEYDQKRPRVKKIAEGRWVLDGSVTCRDFEEQFNCGISEGRVDTLAGFIAERLGRIPVEGDVVTEGSFKFTVEQVRRGRARVINLENILEESENNE
jgi:CBS domain containing-hemolysin-like protein